MDELERMEQQLTAVWGEMKELREGWAGDMKSIRMDITALRIAFASKRFCTNPDKCEELQRDQIRLEQRIDKDLETLNKRVGVIADWRLMVLGALIIIAIILNLFGADIKHQIGMLLPQNQEQQQQ